MIYHSPHLFSQGLKECSTCRVLVTHTCNPSYSGGRDKEDCSSKPAQARTYLGKKYPSKKGLVEWLKV
jgi:hypothetical protein